jgi:hypothetical protein
MPGVYLMPNGKVASVDLGDGRRSLVSRAKFEECCCPPQCQWQTLFYWDCVNEKWERIRNDWVDKIEPPETVIELGDCERLVYGLSADCETEEDDRPEPPPDFEGDPPEEPEECCAPCFCPCDEWPPPCNDLFEQYSISIDLRLTEYNSTTSCGGDVFLINEYRIVPESASITAGAECVWGNDSVSAQNRSKLGDDPFTEWETVATGISAKLGVIAGVCGWIVLLPISTTGAFTFFKSIGKDPSGNYKLVDAGTGKSYASGICAPKDGFWGAAHRISYTATVS